MKALLLASALLVSVNGFCHELSNQDVKAIVQSAYDGMEGKGEVLVTKVSPDFKVDIERVVEGAEDSVDSDRVSVYRTVHLERDVTDIYIEGSVRVKTTCRAIVESFLILKMEKVTISDCKDNGYKEKYGWSMNGRFIMEVLGLEDNSWIHADIRRRYQ